MSRTIIIRRTDLYDHMTKMSRAYYRKDGRTLCFNTQLFKKVSILTGSGGIISTPNDMAKYLLFHLNKGKVGSKQIVSQEAMSWIQVRGNPNPKLIFKTHKDDVISGDYGYELGVSLGIHDGWQTVSHGGYLPPFYSFMSFVPALKIGIFTSSNGPGVINSTNGHEVLHRQIFEILTGMNVKTKPRDKTKITPEEESRLKVKEARQKYLEKIAKRPRLELKMEYMTGVFGNPLSGDFVITIAKRGKNGSGRLYFRSGEWSTGWLNRMPGSKSTYSLEWDSDIVQEMYASPTGGLQEFLVDFSDPNKPIAFFEGLSIGFERDLTIDKLPIQTWDLKTCGPVKRGLPHFSL